MSVFTDGLLVVCEGQHSLTQAAALRECLLVHLFLDVAYQDLRTTMHRHKDSEGVNKDTYNKQFNYSLSSCIGGESTNVICELTAYFPFNSKEIHYCIWNIQYCCQK